MSKLSKLTGFLDRLDEADIHYSLTSIREKAVMVGITTPGERWEVEFFANGEVEVEHFKSDGEISGFSAVDQIFERARDD